MPWFCAAPVHPHAGESAGLQRSLPRLLRLPPDGGAARKTGVLHGHHEDAAAGADGRARAEQTPKADAPQVRGGGTHMLLLNQLLIYTVKFSQSQNIYRQNEAVDCPQQMFQYQSGASTFL